MSERDRTLKELIEDVGVSPERAELMMERDDDLWILSPSQRFVFEGAEDIRQWEEAWAFAEALRLGFTHHGVGVVNEATAQLLWDLEERAEEALRRARQRVKEAQQSS